MKDWTLKVWGKITDYGEKFKKNSLILRNSAFQSIFVLKNNGQVNGCEP